MNVEQFKKSLRFKYVAGDQAYFVLSDGDCLCHDCATDNRDRITEAMSGDAVIRYGTANTGWEIKSYCVNWDKSPIECDHCGNRI